MKPHSPKSPFTYQLTCISTLSALSVFRSFIHPSAPLPSVAELKTAGLGGVNIVQTSEKHFLVKQTGVGATVSGLVNNQDLKVKKCESGGSVVAIGCPCVGSMVVEGEKNEAIADLDDVNALLKLPYVHEIIPVGSKGILSETRVIAADSGLQFLPRQAVGNYMKSAGPATVILCATSPSRVDELNEIIDKPLSFVDQLR